MFVAEREVDGIVILELSGKLMGGPDASVLNSKLHELTENDKKKIIVDLANVSLMNSSGLGIVIGGLSTIRNSGGELKLANATDRVKNLLTITKLTKVFEIHDNIESAIASFKKS